MINDGRKRVVIENMQPSIDGGVFAIKRSEGDTVPVSADVFCDGHDLLGAHILFRHSSEQDWSVAVMSPLDNDRWEGTFTPVLTGIYLYTVEAWVDHFHTWQRDVLKKFNAGQNIALELRIGSQLITDAAVRVPFELCKALQERARVLTLEQNPAKALLCATDKELSAVITAYPDLSLSTKYSVVLELIVERKKALFSTWYEFFPRSTAGREGLIGSFKDCEKRLQYIADLGFDVLYLPPIHPIGFTNRKGKNNSVIATGADPGSPWAIGSAMGGHKSVEPSLGTLDDFVGLINAATSFGIEIAMDIAFQCSPDHPYVKEHPEWFQTRPDGTIQFAENPPKKYEDIVPFNFETNEWKALWEELKDVFLFWIDKGITIFRVDNPHTKPLSFWEWIIKEIRHIYPDVIFLSEAFTRPKIMYRLAKLGFSQSYSYFTWRNTKQELITYFKDLTNTSIAEYFRPCLWPATPDILPEFLQFGGDNAFAIRFILAATLSSCYGIYGPAFELAVNSANPGKEEYLNSEKYEIKHWIFPNDSKLKLLISKVNAIRREYESLQVFRNLHFHDVNNEQLLFFSKMSTDMSGAIFVVVNLDPFHTQEGVLTVPFSDLGLKHDDLDIFHDLLTGERFFVSGNHITVKLNPDITPAYIFKVVARMGRETKFEYY